MSNNIPIRLVFPALRSDPLHSNKIGSRRMMLQFHAVLGGIQSDRQSLENPLNRCGSSVSLTNLPLNVAVALAKPCSPFITWQAVRAHRS